MKKIDKAVFPGTQGGPLEHVIAAKAVAFKEASELEIVLSSDVWAHVGIVVLKENQLMVFSNFL